MSKIIDHYDDVGPGWKDILTAAHEEIQAIDPEYSVFQVKEKFGGLRLYLSGLSQIHSLARKHEMKSWTTCEVCGQPGKPNDQSEHIWILTLCPEHRAELNTRNKTVMDMVEGAD